MTHLLDPTTVEDDVKVQYSKKKFILSGKLTFHPFYQSFQVHIHIQHFDASALSPESRLNMEAGRQRNVCICCNLVTVSKVMRLQVTGDQVTGAGEQGVEEE